MPDSNLTGTEKTILLCISIHTATHGVLPTQAQLATATKLASSTVGRYLDRLRARGFLTRYDRDRRRPALTLRGQLAVEAVLLHQDMVVIAVDARQGALR